MVSRSLVLAYHGCDESVARKVAAGDEDLQSSHNEYDWLGGGLYFWEDSHARALQWAKREMESRSRKVTKPAVLGAVVDLGNCLNLIDAKHLELVRTAHREYLNICQISGLTPAQNKGSDLRARYLDKAVFETLHQLRKETEQEAFDTVRAFFVEGAPLYDGAGLRDLDHIQICVRNPRKIVGYFLPRQAE